MYCELCRRPVCHLCKLGGNHSNHRVTTMSSAYKTLKVGLVFIFGTKFCSSLFCFMPLTFAL